jgi:hypothetical protein
LATSANSHEQEPGSMRFPQCRRPGHGQACALPQQIVLRCCSQAMACGDEHLGHAALADAATATALASRASTGAQEGFLSSSCELTRHA